MLKSYFKSNLLYWWKIVATSHDTGLDELFSTQFMQYWQILISFEFFIIDKLLPKESLTLSIKTHFQQDSWATVGNEIGILTDSYIC